VAGLRAGHVCTTLRLHDAADISLYGIASYVVHSTELLGVGLGRVAKILAHET
jgi:hypothetical protein